MALKKILIGILFLVSIHGYSQDLSIFPKSDPSWYDFLGIDLGFELSEVQENDLLDSIARLELEGYQFFPDFIGSLKSKNNYWDNPIFYIEDSDSIQIANDTILIGFAPSRYIQNYFPNAFMYQIKGIKIFEFKGLKREEIYRDSLIHSGISDTALIKVAVERIWPEENYGEFEVEFDQVQRVDGKGREFIIPELYKLDFSFRLDGKRDKLEHEYGTEEIQLIVNDEPYHEGDYIPHGAQTYLTLKISPNFISDHPDEAVYQIRGVRIREQMFHVKKVQYEVYTESDWSNTPQIPIPIDSLSVKHSGSYYLGYGEILRKGADGTIFHKSFGFDEIGRPHSQIYFRLRKR